MNQFGKILVPVDFSERSVASAQFVSHLVEGMKSDVLFLHVIGPDWRLTPEEEEARSHILDVVKSTRGSFQIRPGEPSAVILDVARKEAADLIVMSPRKAPASARWLGHSTTARVLRTATCPVWVGIGDLSNAKPIRNVLCGLSLGPGSASVLRWASSLTDRLGAAISIVHASKGLDRAPHYPLDSEWRLSLQRMMKADIQTLQSDAATRAQVWLEAGGPRTALPQAADRLGSDLLVIGKSPRRRLLADLRTMSYDVALRAPCPIVSV